MDYVLLKNGSWLLLRHIYVALFLLVILGELMCLAFNRNFADCFWPEVLEACSLDVGYKCQVVRWMLAQSFTPLQFEGPLGLLADFEGGILAVILLVGFICFHFFFSVSGFLLLASGQPICTFQLGCLCSITVLAHYQICAEYPAKMKKCCFKKFLPQKNQNGI